MDNKTEQKFIELVKSRLTKYKSEHLTKENGIWKNNKKKYPHILPEEDKELNILKLYRDEFWKEFPKRNIKLHKDFHHMNSSQALCFNLFYPFAKYIEHFSVLGKELDMPNFTLQELTFEKILEKTEGTNFDFYIKYTNHLGQANNIYFELKYTENGFGTTNNDEKHREKFKYIYKDRLEKILQTEFHSQYLKEDFFFKHYQIFRNLSYIDENSIVIFVLPKAHFSLVDDLKELNLLEDNTPINHKFRNNFKILYLEELIDSLIKNSKGIPKLLDYFNEFKEKYILDS